MIFKPLVRRTGVSLLSVNHNSKIFKSSIQILNFSTCHSYQSQYHQKLTYNKSDWKKLISLSRQANTQFFDELHKIYSKTNTIPIEIIPPLITRLELLEKQNAEDPYKNLKIPEFVLSICEKLKYDCEKLSSQAWTQILSYIYRYQNPALRCQALQLARSLDLPLNSLSAIYSQTIISFLTDWEIEQALSLMSEASARDVQLSALCNEIMIHKLLELGETQIAIQIMKTMNESSSQVIYSRLWGHFVAAASTFSDAEALAWAWKTAIEPAKITPSDSACYASVLASLQINDSKMGLKAINILCNRDFERDPLLLTAAIEHLSTQKYTQETFLNMLRLLQLFGENSDRLKISDTPTFIALITSIINNTQQKNSMPNLKNVNPQSIDQLQNYLRRSDILSQFKYFMKHPKTHPHAATFLFNTLCMAIIKSEKPQLLTSLLEYLPQPFHYKHFTIRPNIDTLRILTTYCVRQENGIMIEQYYNLLVPRFIPSSKKTSIILLEGLLELSHLEKALIWLKELKNELGGSSGIWYKDFKQRIDSMHNENYERNLESYKALFPGQHDQPHNTPKE